MNLLRDAQLALRNRKLPECEAALRQLEAEGPLDAEALHIKGLFHAERDGYTTQARELLQASLEAAPDRADFMHNFATFEATTSRMDEAQNLLREALDRKPDYFEAFHTLAGVTKFKPDDPLIKQMEQQATSRKFSPTDASFLCFGLAKAYEDIGDYEKAWHLVEQANAAEKHDYDIARTRRGVNHCKQVFSPTFLEEKSQGGDGEVAPVFVIGLPRSGTTLVEALLARHGSICPAGELACLDGISQSLHNQILGGPWQTGGAASLAVSTPDHRAAMAKAFVAAARKQGATGPCFVDKTPDNSFNIGLAATLFPKAKFVHVMRHPLDTAISIYFQRFSRGVFYGFNKDTLAQHAKAYQSVMDHWRALLGDRLIEVRYENIINDDDFAAARLIHFAGFDPADCSDEDKKVRHTVKTASRWQVRQPVYKSSKEKWRRYESHIEPLVQAHGGWEAIERVVALQDHCCTLTPPSSAH